MGSKEKKMVREREREREWLVMGCFEGILGDQSDLEEWSHDVQGSPNPAVPQDKTMQVELHQKQSWRREATLGFGAREPMTWGYEAAVVKHMINYFII